MKHSQVAADLTIHAESNGTGKPLFKSQPNEAGWNHIGYGHVVSTTDKLKMPLSADYCRWMLEKDLERVDLVLNAFVPQSIAQHQYDALVAWAFHAQPHRVFAHNQIFEEARLLQYLDESKMQLAAAEFDNWVLVGGRVSKRAVARRSAEKYLFLNGKLPQDVCSSSRLTCSS